MKDISFLNSSEFNIDRLLNLKGNRRIFAVFSTFGEREAQLVYDKISLLYSEANNFIDKIFLSHRRVTSDKIEQTEINAKRAHPDVEVLICNSMSVPDMGDERGKGADMRRLLYYVNRIYRGSTAENEIIIVFLDADVESRYFGTHFVLGLAGAIIEGFDFAKASFWRAMGRVKKYVAQPLFSLIEHPKLKMLTKFAYPLSGEVAGTLDFFNSVDFWQMYGIETGMIIDACFKDYRVADVNLGLYDHEHQSEIDIQKMSFGIMRTFLMQLLKHDIIGLKDGAKIGNIFELSYINENAKRSSNVFELNELRYTPLKILFDSGKM
ncbi:MAG: hypothetical protein SVZ03_04790 [Spirochaetota bacterium]|nr:hypothetical protein [Spirochaetota bacterium]